MSGRFQTEFTNGYTQGITNLDSNRTKRYFSSSCHHYFRNNVSTSVEMWKTKQERWPRAKFLLIIYFAFRYWQIKSLQVSVSQPDVKKIVSMITNMKWFLQTQIVHTHFDSCVIMWTLLDTILKAFEY